MATAPVLKATTAQAETFAGVTYQVDRELVPVLTVEISGVPVYFEHHILLWKDRSVTMQTQFQKLSTGLFASAGQLTWNRCSGPGRIGLQSMYIHLGTAE